MTRLTRILRTTAFKLSLLYIAIFTGLSGFLLIYISRNTTELMASQVVQTVDAEISGLSEEYVRGGVRAVVESIERRARRPDASIYLLVDFAGNSIVGNISRLPTVVLDEADGDVRRMKYGRVEAGGEVEREALVRIFELRGGFRLLVGRDLGEQLRFSAILSGALRFWLIAVVLMAGATWFFVSRRVMKRIDDIAATSQTIMHGDLSRRLPVAGNGDEFDRLATNLNDMLERIELLMQGMKDVTDNIAHDLKTPLTRMRTRVETVLREGKDQPDYREALEATIEDSDNLIRIFDALLRIARVEAMSPEAGMEPFDLKAVIDEMAELYAPVVEDEDGRLEVAVEEPATVMGSRDLIAQCVVNLVENVLKYGSPEEGGPVILIKAVPEAGRMVLTVSDTGPGISGPDRDRVTGRFVRLDESRTKPGYGLGLSLVRAIARLHGGTLRLQDAAPGLKVSIDLALADEKKTPNGKGVADHGAGNGS
ncbi:HAMP domain-containing sensor histidine kinase [Roseibium polysiphoniae]|uniref:sensor histidine kinase n=1 Tax=Roseibium polysiphoniae TaxID=2571221 RepID=UPI00329A0167